MNLTPFEIEVAAEAFSAAIALAVLIGLFA